MAEAPVLYSKHDSIVTLTLNRPATLNAMNVAMMAEFERLLLDIAADGAAVVLTGPDGPSLEVVTQKREQQTEETKCFLATWEGRLSNG
jgi:1,4-dihydroxy-2-naphthoyl-CoA synthase